MNPNKQTAPGYELYCLDTNTEGMHALNNAFRVILYISHVIPVILDSAFNNSLLSRKWRNRTKLYCQPREKP